MNERMLGRNLLTVAALGVACFGPIIGLNRDDARANGRVLASSPKKAWRGADVLTPLSRVCGGSPHLLETDVNAPAAAEFARRNYENDDDGSTRTKTTSLSYVTVGTGVGVGFVVPVHGRTKLL